MIIIIMRTVSSGSTQNPCAGHTQNAVMLSKRHGKKNILKDRLKRGENGRKSSKWEEFKKHKKDDGCSRVALSSDQVFVFLQTVQVASIRCWGHNKSCCFCVCVCVCNIWWKANLAAVHSVMAILYGISFFVKLRWWRIFEVCLTSRHVCCYCCDGKILLLHSQRHAAVDLLKCHHV